ncbi:GNAT family N-acetyltransferase [Deltaproteobacteria bacterium TL4]
MKYQFSILNTSKGYFFKNFTYPVYQSVLMRTDLGEPQTPVLAIGVLDKNKPIGLTIANIDKNEKKADLLSVFVEKAYRRQGLATQLIEAVEKALKEKGCEQFRADYETGRPITSTLEGLLGKTGFPKAKALALIGRCHDIRKTNIPWVEKIRVPSAFEIFPWTELKPEDKEKLERHKGDLLWYSETLSPFRDSAIFEPLTSVGLRHRQEVVGWHITHRIARDTIRYTAVFVRKDLQPFGLIFPLLGTSIRLQIENKDEFLKKITFMVFVENEGMSTFMKKRMKPHLDELNESMQSIKIIG